MTGGPWQEAWDGLWGVHRQAHFVFEATTHCNQACAACPRRCQAEAATDAGPVLDTKATLKLLARMARQTKAADVTLTGGEPLLRDDVFELVDFLARRRVGVQLVTNGRLLDRRAIGRLLGKVTRYELPLLSARPALHDAMSGAAGAFDHATEAMAALKAAGAHVVGVFLATRRNLPTFLETAELGARLGLDALKLEPWKRGGATETTKGDTAGGETAGGETDELGLEPSPEAMEEARAVAREVTARTKLPIREDGCLAASRQGCLTLDARGNIRRCLLSPSVLGSLAKVSLRALVQSAPSEPTPRCPDSSRDATSCASPESGSRG